MEPKSSNLLKATVIFLTLFFVAGVCRREAVCLAADSGELQTEAVVINVDKWAVYVPDQVFYFDTQMSRSKIETLQKTANQLRNRKALISYHATGDNGTRAVISNIAPSGEEPSVEKSVSGTAAPADEAATKVGPASPEAKPLPGKTARSPIGDTQVAAFVEALRMSAPHTGIADDGLYSDWKIKADNIIRWSRRCLGREISPEEFASDPGEARQIVGCVAGKVLREQYEISKDQYVAVCRAASWWMTGDPGKFDTPPTSSYTMKVLGYYMRGR